MASIGTENWDIWADLDGSNNVQTRYLRGDVVDQVFARYDAVGGVPAWLLTDRMGSVRDVLNNGSVVKDTIVYDGFGNITSETDSTWRGRYAWTGRELDTETNLQYNRARYYDGATGRWISQDPLGFDAGDSNLYRYVTNRPTDQVDPSGLTIYVYAFDGAGAKLKFSMAPVNTVVRQAVQAGAGKQKLVYHYYSWAGVPLAQVQLNFDRLRCQEDKWVVIGYSWGGNSAFNFAQANWVLGVKWDLVFTIDPINGVPGVPFIPPLAALAQRWVNYWQNEDQGSLKVPVFGVLVPIPGQPIGNGVTNVQVKAADFNQKAFHLDVQQGKETAYPNGKVFVGIAKFAHVFIPYYHPLLDDLKNRIAAL